MWTCPDCARSFANTNQSHACQSTTEGEYLSGRPPETIAIYNEVTDSLDAAGEYRRHAKQEGIGFISRMTFAGISLARSWADLHFILPRPLDDSRIRRIEAYGPATWLHRVRLLEPADVDDSVRDWLQRAWRRGNQENLGPSKPLSPLTSSQLAVFRAGLTAKVGIVEKVLAVPLPPFLGEALAPCDGIGVRVLGLEFDSPLVSNEGVLYLLPPASLDLVDGQVVEVYLRHALSVAD